MLSSQTLWPASCGAWVGFMVPPWPAAAPARIPRPASDDHLRTDGQLAVPGIGAVLGAWVPGESGDDPHRYAGGKARKNYAATSPLTRASAKKKVVTARFIRNDRLVDALNAQAFASLNASPGARAIYDALRRLANRLAGTCTDGCLKTRTLVAGQPGAELEPAGAARVAVPTAASHTLAFHLRYVFWKLGVTSRVQLARMSAEQAATG